MQHTVALVPAFDEAERVAATVEGLLGIDGLVEVIVVDDGSSDATSHQAARAGARCLSLPRNVGKGDALNAGVALIRQRITEGILGVPSVLLLADADLSQSAANLEALVERVLSRNADLVIADLPPQPGASGFGLAKGLAARGLRHFAHKEFAEPLSGQRAIAWSALPALLPFAPGFGVEIAMTLAAVRAGLVIEECMCDIRHRPTARDLAGVVHRGRQGAAIAAQLGGYALRISWPLRHRVSKHA